LTKIVNISRLHKLRSRREPVKKSCFFLFLFAAAVIALSGCQKKEHFPDTPEIEYQDYFNEFSSGVFAVKGVLTFSYHDGDGDIGLRDSDTLLPYQPGGSYYYNLVIQYFEKQNGVFTEIALNPPLSSRIPVLSPLYAGKAIKGTITDTIMLNPHPSFDTIQMKVFIYDRRLHKSNVISTPEIILRKH
jgi:hypothetical protein